MRRRRRWLTRAEREAQREAIERAGGVLNWIREGRSPKPITDEERARRAAVNALANRHGFPRPYPDLDRTPQAAS